MLFSKYFPSYENILHYEVWVLQIVAYSLVGFDAMSSVVDLSVLEEPASIFFYPYD